MVCGICAEGGRLEAVDCDPLWRSGDGDLERLVVLRENLEWATVGGLQGILLSIHAEVDEVCSSEGVLTGRGS